MKDEPNVNEIRELNEQWRRECLTRCQGKDEAFVSFSDSGIPLKPVFTPEDVANIPYKEIGMPGVYPFTRGGEPLPDRSEPVKTWVLFGYGLPEDTRKRMDLFLQTPGFTQMSIAVDAPSYHGYDPDHPLARGKVGHCGTSICNTEDLEIIFDQVDLEKFRIAINAPFAAAPMLALLIAYAEKRGVSPHALKGYSNNRAYKACWGFHPCFPAKEAVDYMVELIKYCCKNMPFWKVMVLDGYIIREQGGDAIQELAFIMALARCIAEEVKKAGLSPDDFVSRVSVKLNSYNDFFEEIAKFRAFRKVWAKICLEKLGCKDRKSLSPDWVVIQTGGSTLTAQQPLNNIVRVTTQTLAALIGGIPFVDPAAYDEALALPTEGAETITIRTGQILFHENRIRNVLDPMAGSYYVEYLTAGLEAKVYEMLDRIEDQGGFIKCWEDGWFRSQIETEAYKWRERVDRKERIVVGVNEFVTQEETPVPVFQIDPQVEKIMVKRLEDFKRKRNNAEVSLGLEKLGEVAKNKGELMPALIDAAKADATLGEMMEVLRRVYGWIIYR